MRVTTVKRSAKPTTERLEARVPAPIKDLIGRAASLDGVTLTDFVIATLQKSAAEVVREHEVLNLRVRDSAAFAKTMLAPPKPNRKLTQAFARHQQSVIVKQVACPMRRSENCRATRPPPQP